MPDGAGLLAEDRRTADDRPVILEMQGITKRFSGVVALSDVTMRVRAGEIHAICGENGAGKSTLMKVLSGVYPSGTYEGRVLLDGQEVQFKDVRQSEAAGVVIIHQELALIPELSITENIFLGNEIARGGVIDWVDAQQRAVELLARVGLNDDPDTKIKQLGVGKQQLVEIAKALNKRVRLLILDEPTAALNEAESQHLLDLMRGLRSRGVTMIMISHKLAEIEQVADAITILRDGRTIETFDAASGISEERIIRGMVGRDLGNLYPDHVSTPGDVFFEVRDWTVQHPQNPSRLVCDNESFFVRRGEIVGFAGLMGAGRTELAMSLFGHSYGVFVSGTIVKDGMPIVAPTVRAAIQAGIGYVSEDRKALGVNLLDTVKRSIVSANLGAISRRGVVDPLQEQFVAEDYRSRMNIKVSSVEQGVAKLSGGNQQKVVLSKWIYTDPDLLILDEPTRGIDVGAKYEIYKIIHALADQGKGIILISSELPELLGVSDRIYTLFEGKITNVMPTSDATQESLMLSMTSARGR